VRRDVRGRLLADLELVAGLGVASEVRAIRRGLDQIGRTLGAR
jgi:hypothetical protein